MEFNNQEDFASLFSIVLSSLSAGSYERYAAVLGFMFQEQEIYTK